jgi:hypothetical protein
VYEPTASELLPEDGTKQRIPTEAAHFEWPAPAHEAMVENQSLYASLVGQELIGAPVVAIGRLQLRSSFLDPLDQRVTELIRRG